MKVAGVLLAIALALALQTTLARFVGEEAGAIDLVLVLVVYVALGAGPVAGLLTGTVGGIAQDALSGGIIGVGGLTKTLVGFVVGVAGRQFIVARPLPRFVVFFTATIAQGLLFMGLYLMLDGRGFASPYATLAGQAVGNGIAGLLAFQIVEVVPVLAARRRESRSRASRRRLRHWSRQ